MFTGVIENTKNLWISITGYRILLILKALIEKDCSIDELISVLKSNKITDKAISKDTVRIAINTLKMAGCEFSKPSKLNNYKYRLIKNPFVLNLSESEINALIKLREKQITEIAWQDIFCINDLYEKIASLTNNEQQMDLIVNSQPLRDINRNILKELLNPSFMNKKIQIKYLSPEYGEEDIEILPNKILFENEKLYLWCHIYKYDRNSLLSVERILKINQVNIANTKANSKSYDVVYEIWGDSVLSFKKKDNEEILEETKYKIQVLSHVENEFLFIQRLLLFGTEFKIIYPVSFKEKLIRKIKQTQKGYI